MSANDDFPNSAWLEIEVADGSTAAITVPAMPGISWVLKHFDGAIWGIAPTNASILIAAQTNQGIGILVISVQAGGNWAKDTYSWDGSIEYPPDTAFVVGMNSPSIVGVLGEIVNVEVMPVPAMVNE